MLLVFSIPHASAVANPAAVYCIESGYSYEIESNDQGEYGICIFPDESECMEWDFFNGSCGEEFAQQTDISGKLEATAPDFPEKPAQKLLLGATQSGFGSEYNYSDYAAWDWRNPPAGTVFEGNDWMTSVKNQGSCGSCWAFSALGTVEAKYNIYNNDSSIDLDLSEQEHISCGGKGNCSGGLPEDALNYTESNGTVDESCFSYLGCKNWNGTQCLEEWPCSRCADYEDRNYKIDGWIWIGNSTSAIKQALINYGPLAVALDYGELLGDVSGAANHAVVLVGWNDTESNWTIKNSWGTGVGDNGYQKIPYGDIEKHNYIIAVNITETKPDVTLASPDNNANESAPVNFNCSAYDIDGINGLKNITLFGNFTGTWQANETKNLTGTGNSTIFSLDLSEGSYVWNCLAYDQRNLADWGDNNFTLNIISSYVDLNYPENNYNNSNATVIFNCSANSTADLVNISVYVWNSTSLFYSNTTNVTGTSNSSEWQTDLTENQQYNWSCLAFADSTGVWADNRSLAIDAAAPSISIISPSATLVRSIIWINASYSDSLTGIKEAKYNITNSSGSKANGNLNTSYNTSALADGNYTINYTASDWADNSNGTEKNITVDNTKPSVDLDISDSSIDEGDSVNITCTASDTNGIKNISMTYSGGTIETCSSSPCEEEYEPSWTGTKTITCTAYDNASNSDTDTASLKVDEGGGGGSSSGGDDDEEPQTYDITDDLEDDREKTKTLGEGDSLKFKINKSSHTLKVSSVYSDKVKLEISSDTFYVNVSVNETKQVDVDNNSINDLAITLLSIISDQAKLKIELLEENPTEEKNIADNITDIANITNAENITQPSQSAETQGKTNYWWIAVPAVLIALIVFAIHFIRKFTFIKFGKKHIIRRK